MKRKKKLKNARTNREIKELLKNIEQLDLLYHRLWDTVDYHSFQQDINIIYKYLYRHFRNLIKIINKYIKKCFAYYQKEVKTKNRVKKVSEKDNLNSIKNVGWDNIALYFLIAFTIGLFVGYIPFIGTSKEKKEVAINKSCDYSQWQEVESQYCFVNSDGSGYEGETVKYVIDSNNGECKKYIRWKTCN